MQKLLLISLFFSMISCGVQRDITGKHQKTNIKNTTQKYQKTNTSKEAELVLEKAKTFIGTPYKYGGTTAKGLDCSGLSVLAFDEVGETLPRTCFEQSKTGLKISLKEAKVGDLLFFNTSGNRISHVGIIESITQDDIYFIHSSSSKGVIITPLSNSYWKTRFVEVRRVL